MTASTKEIIGRLEASGFMTEKCYMHDQLVDQMKGFEQAALREVFREGYSDSLRTYDLISHFRDMASQYALCDTEVYGRLTWALQRLCKEISSLVNGARGERALARALGWLKCEHEVLLNVELEYEGERCEYDALVFTPAGIDIIESKFCSHDSIIDGDGFLHDLSHPHSRRYNVGEKMRAKEHVLFSIINAASPGLVPRADIRSVLFAANNGTIIEDRFGLVDVCNSGQLCPLIESRSEASFDRNMRDAAVSAVEGARQTFHYEPEIDFDQLRSDIADFIVMTERAAARSSAADERTVESLGEKTSDAPVAADIRIPEIFRETAAVVGCALGVGAAWCGVSRLLRRAS